MALAGTSSSMLHKNDESVHPCLVLDLRVKSLSIEYDISYGLFIYSFYYVVTVPFYCKCVECFCFCFHERVLHCFQMLFLPTSEMIK